MDRIKRGERVKHFETVRVRKDGVRVDVSLTISPVRNAEGKVIGASKIARDITARKARNPQYASLQKPAGCLANCLMFQVPCRK